MLVLLVVACSPSSATDDAAGGADGNGTTTGSTADGGGGNGTGAGFQSGSTTGSGGDDACVPPDMLIALDRTLTMHRMPDGTTPTDAPDYESAKWSQAIGAIETLVTPSLDQSIRFGLELWPKEEPGCITLVERIQDTVQATNPSCSDGEILHAPSLGASGAITTALDPLTTKICLSTPTGAGLLTASTQLAAIQEPDREQYIMLVTDGADWDQSCPTPDPVAVTQELAAQGIKTFVLGFSATGDIQPGGVGAPFLNDMACAGMTAPDFAQSCQMGATGYVAVDPMGPTLYLQASDGDALAEAMGEVAAAVCCDCVE